jgi:hypothetical protein
MTERIILSAIWYKLLKYPGELYSPKNIKEGLVITGHRHPDIIHNVYLLTGKRTAKNGKDATGEYVQGFITNTNRFVNRIEAADIAVKSKQIISGSSFSGRRLYSEDLW